MVTGEIMGTRNLHILYVHVPMAERIGLMGQLSLCTLGNPYKIPGFEPEAKRG